MRRIRFPKHGLIGIGTLTATIDVVTNKTIVEGDCGVGDDMAVFATAVHSAREATQGAVGSPVLPFAIEISDIIIRLVVVRISCVG